MSACSTSSTPISDLGMGSVLLERMYGAITTLPAASAA